MEGDRRPLHPPLAPPLKGGEIQSLASPQGRGTIESSLPSREGDKKLFLPREGNYKGPGLPSREGNYRGPEGRQGTGKKQTGDRGGKRRTVIARLTGTGDRQKKNCHCEEAAKQEEAEKGAYRDEE
ncbi:MAG: hypothetical protein AB1743_06750 [Actinomycetota bacterium]